MLNMMRGALVMLALVVGASASAGSVRALDQASDQPDQAMPRVPFLGGFLQESRIVYPLQVGQWEAMGEKRYDHPELGVSVRYAQSGNSDGWIDVYFYPAGVLSDEQLEAVARSELDGIRNAAVQRGLAEPMIGELLSVALTVSQEPDAEPVKGHVVGLVFTQDGQRIPSAMAIVLDRLYFIKGRYSVKGALMEEAGVRLQLQEFFADLVPQLRIVSRGACWSEMPIQQMEGDVAPAEALMSMSDEDRLNGYVLPDRIVARDPDSNEAKALMLMGMVATERLFPGCVPAESINPDVAEGMREIRIEYRAGESMGPPVQPVGIGRMSEA
ncbi:hypothetical protein N792_05745 [Lysobacter concretionis Ko07 = DSM 16239]|uniref:Uncharacterized protein n=1 Tax=Lysobacter concretionis Ko07 = DSM 16239 TaxID=1122185 RepID=A0A0A0ENK1_9GAMM|nr:MULTISPECIES: hypothetical protein [Lysobacter]KGM52566.1 hypothetical protein N792_05745 [Lysobacter concretionis Ko07 = DSM 16239]QOD91679.1 hypothetical protein H2514_03235 [Lysobacter sp. CW239]